MFRRQSAGRWRRSCPVGTCSPSARVLRRHVFFVNQLLGAAFTFPAHTPTTPAPLALLFHSLHTHTDSLRSAPFWRAASDSPPIGGKHGPFPQLLSSPGQAVFLHPRLADALPDLFPSPFHHKPFFLFLLFFLPAVSAGNLAEEEPRHGSRGELSLHGARSLWV